MSNSVVVIETIVQTVLGIVDEEGNVVETLPLSVKVAKLEESLFLKALEVMKDHKNKAIELQSNKS